MNKILGFAVVSLAMSLAVANGASSFKWQASGVKDVDGTTSLADYGGGNDGYAVWLVKGTDGTINFNGATKSVGGDESVWVGCTWGDVVGGVGIVDTSAEGFGANLADLNSNPYFYTVLFNGSVGAADKYLILDSSAKASSSFPLDGAGIMTYNVNSWSTINTTWTAVPEPTTMGLLGVGAVVMAMRRRSKK